MKRDFILFIEDILETIEDIDKSINNLSKNMFMIDKDKKDATLRRLEVIGEAVKNLPESFRKKYSKVPWRNIAGFRDVLTHTYFGIDLERVWKILKDDLPVLKEQIKTIFNKENGK